MKKIFSIICLSLLLFLSFGVNKFEVHAATPVGSPVTLSISTYFDSDNIVTASTGSIAYGSQVSFASSLNPSSSTGYEFVCWLVNGTVQYLPEDYTFTATNNLELTGVFKPVGEYSVIFMDANGQKIDIQYVALNGAAVEPSTVSYTKPGYVYQTPSKWSVPFNDVTFDIITVLQYVPDETPTSLSLTVENGTDITSKGPGPYSLNNVVTVQAAADTAIEFFQYWRIENTIVSYEATYSFTMLQNTTITAVYGGTPATDAPLISLVSGINIRENYTSFLGNIYLPSEDTLVEFGLITHATLVDFTLDDDNVTQIVGTKINPETNEFLFSLTSLGIEHVRAYLVYKEGEVLHTIYSGSETPELFISEYGEGSSNNKWIEIYNPTSGGVNLNDYHLELYTNGSTTGVAYAFPTDYVLAAGDTYVYYNTSASDTVKSYGDGSSPVANFNGNDAIGLFKNTTLIDQFGIIGNDPGTNWFENGISTIDHTLIRKLYVTTPNANWNPSEWLQFDIDYFNNIGVVGFPSPSEVVISGGTSVYVGYATQLSATVNPHGTAQTVLWTTSDDAIATVSSTGLVTGVSPGIVTITATSVQDFGVYNT
ncbi:MAG: lamin tail domain-containing protein, partial [Candidatus Izemoplasmatales bacterium]|nr:lamin tail domain-containing protein [Candidatus Izemoplasmatales bacterium]